jgi:hypothetical protein
LALGQLAINHGDRHADQPGWRIEADARLDRLQRATLYLLSYIDKGHDAMTQDLERLKFLNTPVGLAEDHRMLGDDDRPERSRDH